MCVSGEPRRVAFQGEPGAFSEEAAVRLLGEGVVTLPQPSFDAAFHAVTSGDADALLVPIENSLAGSVLRVYDLLLGSDLTITAETILPVELHLMACPGATLASIRTVESHPMALAQCERLFAEHPGWARIAAEDTAGSVRSVVQSGDLSRAAIAGARAARCHGGAILARDVQDNAENFTRFLLLAESTDALPRGDKLTLALRLPHLPGALLAVLEPFARRGLNLLKIESRPIHGCPWEYQFYLDVEVGSGEPVVEALQELRRKAQSVRVLGCYTAARPAGKRSQAVSGRGT